MAQKSNSIQDTGSCPYLGILDDPKVSYSFPIGSNLCYQADPPESISLAYQEEVCLCQGIYETCPGFENTWGGSLPSKIRNKNIKLPRPGLRIMWIGVSLLIVVVVGYFGLGILNKTEPIQTLDLPFASRYSFRVAANREQSIDIPSEDVVIFIPDNSVNFNGYLSVTTYTPEGFPYATAEHKLSKRGIINIELLEDDGTLFPEYSFGNPIEICFSLNETEWADYLRSPTDFVIEFLSTDNGGIWSQLRVFEQSASNRICGVSIRQGLFALARTPGSITPYGGGFVLNDPFVTNENKREVASNLILGRVSMVSSIILAGLWIIVHPLKINIKKLSYKTVRLLASIFAVILHLSNR